MHKGARFHRCDFQVHTPRDLNWNGARPQGDEGRRMWAAAFVAACRARNLDAVAITDHHDTVMLPYVRDAAAMETAADGTPLPPERWLAVFPGMELSLSVPCQAIVIFDADLPNEHLAQLPGALGYAPAPIESDTTAPTEKLAIKDVNDVADRLDRISYLRGRFAVLPHVQENGHRTLIRSGFDAHYRAFRGFGGYVDGVAPPTKTGARNILEGLDPAYGNKALAIIQTSDSRRADFRHLGEHSTWIKWSRPTAEALRQSCLARHSRVRHEAPKLPDIVISRIEVSSSRFLGRVNAFLSPEYNAIIGGRGTGKSTLLEYVRWALCVPGGRDQEQTPEPEYERRSRALIEQTLAPVEGSVRVEFLVHGVLHVVDRRTAKSDVPLVIKVGDAEFRATDEEEVRRLLPVEAYSQKQLSSLGGSAADVLRFLLSPARRKIATLEQDAAQIGDRIREAFVRLRATERAQHDATRLRAERDSLAQQREQLQQQFAGLDPKDAAILKSSEGYGALRSARDRWRKELEDARAAISAARTAVAGLPSALPASLPHDDHARSMHDALSAFVGDLRSALDAVAGTFDTAPALKHVRDADAEIDRALADAREQFRAARERAQAHESAIKEVEAISKRIADLDVRLDALERALESGRLARGAYDEAVASWVSVLRSKSDLAVERCATVERHAHRMVRGQVRARADLTRPIGVLADAARGSNVRAERYESLTAYLDAQPDPFESWLRAVEELRGLLSVRADDATLPPCPTLHAAGLGDRELRAIAGKLDEEKWLRVRLATPADEVRFEYRAREGEYIPFEQASAGQRATALMRVLLAEEGVPLIVDQPEDDLDNKVIHEIASDIWQAKSRRQIVFASHNANLVVNGDADLVVVFDYLVAGEQTSGVVRAEGAIDDRDVREAIAEIMEGGRDAFRLRSSKYGF